MSTRRVASATSLAPQALKNSLPPPNVPAPKLSTGTCRPEWPSCLNSMVDWMRERGRWSQYRAGSAGKSTLARRGAPTMSLLKRLLGKDRQHNSASAGVLSLGLKPERGGTVSAEPTPEVTAGMDIRSAIQAFGLELLREECAAKPRKNIFVSPMSVYLALAMVENGAGGETKRAMRRVLRTAADAET